MGYEVTTHPDYEYEPSYSACIPAIRRRLGQQCCLNPVALIGMLESRPMTTEAIVQYICGVTGLVLPLVREALEAEQAPLSLRLSDFPCTCTDRTPDGQRCRACGGLLIPAFEDDDPSQVPEGTGDTWTAPLRKPVR